MCPSCHEAVSSEFLFCPHCGNAADHVCPECQRRVDPDWSFCPACGARRKVISPQTVAVGGLEQIIGLPEPEPRPSNSPRTSRSTPGPRRGA